MNKFYFFTISEQINFMEDMVCENLCQKEYKKNDKESKKKLDFLKKGILQNYQHHWWVQYL